MLEFDPVERELRASVESQLPRLPRTDETRNVAAGDLHTVLDAAAVRALESLANVECQTRT